MDPVKLSIVIVNWNSRELTCQCLESVLGQDLQASCELIVVDNASSDGSCDLIGKRFPQVRLLRNADNVGFARANNQAIRIARGEYLLLLNPDTVLADPALLTKWTGYMDRHRDAAASGCRLVFPDGSHQVGDAGYRPSLSTVGNYALFLSRAFPRRCKGLVCAVGAGDREMVVDWVCGAALLVRAATVAEVGLLDESFYMFAEDIEWGCRMTSLGHQVYYLPFLEIIHLQGGSSAKREDRRVFSLLWLENLRRLYGCYNSGRSLFCYDLLMTIAFLLRYSIYQFRYRNNGDPALGIKSARMRQYLRFSMAKIGKSSKGAAADSCPGQAA